MKTRLIGATEFKAKCLAVLDEIEDQGGTVTVTKRGRPVATIGSGDIVNFDASELWDALRRAWLLLDTHIVVRRLSDPRKLSREQSRVLDEADAVRHHADSPCGSRNKSTLRDSKHF